MDNRDIEVKAREILDNMQQGQQNPKSSDELLNERIMDELNLFGGNRSLTIFYETGQVSTFVTDIDRDKLKQKLGQSSFFILPEFKQASGFKDGEVGINMSKVLFWILRDKSSIILQR